MKVQNNKVLNLKTSQAQAPGNTKMLLTEVFLITVTTRSAKQLKIGSVFWTFHQDFVEEVSLQALLDVVEAGESRGRRPGQTRAAISSVA